MAVELHRSSQLVVGGSVRPLHNISTLISRIVCHVEGNNHTAMSFAETFKSMLEPEVEDADEGNHMHIIRTYQQVEREERRNAKPDENM